MPNQRRYEEAEHYLKQALVEAQEFGQNDPRLLASLKTLAALYRVQERFAESEPLLRLAVEREEADGRDHPELPNDLDLLARVCMAQMKLGDAEASFKREVSLLERKYGADSMEIVPALNSLGRVIPVKALSGPAELIPPSIEAVRQWAFEPTLMSALAVEVVTDISLDFKLGRK